MKTILVIGAGKGLGNGVAEKFGREGFRVILVSRNINNLNNYKKEFEEKNITTEIAVADVADFDNFTKTFEKIIQTYGTPDVLFYNVGITIPDEKIALTPELFIERYKNDVVGAFNCIRLIDTPEFSQKRGSILITGGGFSQYPSPEYLPLSMDKAALRAMVTALAPVLAQKNIYLGTIQVTGDIGSNDFYAPTTIAEEYWKLYNERTTNDIFH